MEARRTNAPDDRGLGSYWMRGLGPSTAATAIIDSQLHIARGPLFLENVRGGHVCGCVGMWVWSSRAKAESLGAPKDMNCTFWLLLPAGHAIPPFFPSGAASCITCAALDASEP